MAKTTTPKPAEKQEDFFEDVSSGTPETGTPAVEPPETGTPAVEPPETGTPETGTPAVEPPSEEAHVPTYEELLAEKESAAKQAKLDAQIAISGEKIARLEQNIKDAVVAKRLFEGDNPTVEMTRKLMEKYQPDEYQRIMSAPDAIAKELAEFRLSLLTDEQKEIALRWSEADANVQSALKAQADLRIEIMSVYPDLLGVAPKPRVSKPNVKGEAKPETEPGKVYSGAVLTGDALKASIQKYAMSVTGNKSIADYLKAGGKISESAYCESAYPGFNLQSPLPEGSNLKAKIHSQWKAIVLDARS